MGNVPELFRLLVVDDSAVFQTLVRDLLRDEPALQVVGEAASGEEALAIAPTLRPDVALVDLTLPGMNGYEAAGRLRALIPDLRVILMSAEDDPVFSETARASGAHGFVGKRALRAPTLLRLLGGCAKPDQAIRRALGRCSERVNDPG
jgi:DNA-binding NarL/FixJ family response regulator